MVSHIKVTMVVKTNQKWYIKVKILSQVSNGMKIHQIQQVYLVLGNKAIIMIIKMMKLDIKKHKEIRRRKKRRRKKKRKG